MKTFLKSIQIEGFKSIRSSTLELRPLNVLIGANGAGKSNLISFFKVLNQIALGDFAFWTQQSAGGASSILHLGSKVTTNLGATLSFMHDQELLEYQFEMVHAPASDAFVFRSDGFNFTNKLGKLNNVQFTVGEKESQLRPVGFGKDETSLKARILRDILASIRPYQFDDTSENARIKQTGTLDDDVFLRSDGANLAAVLYKLKNTHPRHYQRIVDTIRLSTPFFKDFVLEPNSSHIRLRYLEMGSEMIFGVHQMSDGTLRFIALLTLLLQPLEQLPHLIVIDEPELGLHPHALETLLAVIRSISAQRQIIIATQSVSLVDRLEPDEIIVVERQNLETQFKHLDTNRLKKWLENYSLGELWEKNVLGGRPTR